MSDPDRPDTPAPGRRDEEFVAFYRATTRELVAFLLLQGACLVDAADIVQDTMATAYRDWRSITHPRAWAYRVAGRALIRRTIDANRETPVEQPPESHPLLRTTNIDHWEQRQDIIVELATLPPRQRQVMAWTLSGYTPAEIADELCLGRGTVRQNLLLARKALSTRRSRKEGER